MKFLLLTVILAAGWSTGFASRVICYYANWSRYGKPAFNIEDINPSLCTHLVYAFYGIDTNSSIVSRDPWNDMGDEWSKGGLSRFLALKKKNPSVKLLLGVGGSNEGPAGFMEMVVSLERRKVFLESTLQFLRNYKFDGIEIAWVYTGGGGGTEEHKEGFSQLLKEMKPVYEKNGYVLGITTSPLLDTVKSSYDLPTLCKYSDFVDVMTYNYHGPWVSKTGHQAPLYGKDNLNLNATISNYIKLYKAIPEKLNLAVVGFGNTFTLINPGCEDYEQLGKPGKVHPLPYRTFCIQDKTGTWKKLKNEQAGVPYAVDKTDQWVGYEDAKSLADKVKFAKSYKLGGISLWSLDLDDFRGDCGYGKYPLLNAVRTEMLK